MNRIITSIIAILIFATSFAQDYTLVFIGNSITQGALLKSPDTDSPPAQAALYIEQCKGIDVEFRNCGVSGTTSLNFLPVAEQQFPNVLKAASELTEINENIIFSISLGTNDSANTATFGAPVQPVQYYTNMKVIIDELLSQFPKSRVVVHRPIWYSPNTYNGAMYLQSGLDRLQSYTPMIQKLVAHYETAQSGRVYLGDTEAFDFFRQNAEKNFVHEYGHAGIFFLHPNKEGAAALGKYWAQAIMKILDIFM